MAFKLQNEKGGLLNLSYVVQVILFFILGFFMTLYNYTNINTKYVLSPMGLTDNKDPLELKPNLGGYVFLAFILAVAWFLLYLVIFKVL